MTKIKIYNYNQFSGRGGRLKKNAKAEFERAYDSSNPKIKELLAEDIKALGYNSFRSPYIFTHIVGNNSKGEGVVIFENVVIGSDEREVMTSPGTLLKELTK